MSHTDKLIEIIKYLRTHNEGCPWTKEQTHKSLAPFFIEESYEAVEAIDNGNVGDELCSEMGDVLLQIALHAQIAEDDGRFDFDDVAKSICEKLIRRYPTILGDDKDTVLKTPAEVDKKWEEMKDEERRLKGIDPEKASIFDDVPHAIPALIRSQKMAKRSVNAGIDWFTQDHLLDKMDEKLHKMRAEINTDADKVNKENFSAEFGELLFVIAEIARIHDVDAEDSLRQANNRIEKRVRYIEAKLKKDGKNFKQSLKDEVHHLWEEAKLQEKK